MAMTTVKVWSENPGDPTAEGLEIGGIQISYAELVDIDSRETALDRGVTPDLIDLWDNQGGRDWSQLTDWLYQYAEEQEQAGAGTDGWFPNDDRTGSTPPRGLDSRPEPSRSAEFTVDDSADEAR